MKKLLLILGLLISFLIITSVSFALGVEVPEYIRVGLFYNSSAKSSVTLSSPGGIEIGVMRDGVFELIDETDKNEDITITKSSKVGAVKVSGYGEVGDFESAPYFRSIPKKGLALISVDGKSYRGNIEIRRLTESDMTVINHLTMQEYLYGVVPREIGGNSPIEAVKAQAIVARTYAAKNVGRRSKLGFDLMPTVDDQAYGGYEWENDNSNRAVDETDGMVVTYDGKLISGLYFSTSGGYTEDSQNVWSGSYDYLKAVPDTYEPEVQGNTTWEVTKTADEIKNHLKKAGINIGNIVDLVPIEFTEAGRILKLKIIGTNGEEIIEKEKVRTIFGLKSQWYTINSLAPNVPGEKQENKTTEVVENNEDKKGDESANNQWWLITGTEDDEDEQEDTEPKVTSSNTEYGGKASFYTKNYEELIVKEKEQGEEYIVITPAKEMKPLLKSLINILSLKPIEAGMSALSITKSKVVETKEKYHSSSDKSEFVFRGRGWGHAVGMSQNGAKGMAQNGFNAEEIIKWYYTGVEVSD